MSNIGPAGHLWHKWLNIRIVQILFDSPVVTLCYLHKLTPLLTTNLLYYIIIWEHTEEAVPSDTSLVAGETTCIKNRHRALMVAQSWLYSVSLPDCVTLVSSEVASSGLSENSSRLTRNIPSYVSLNSTEVLELKCNKFSSDSSIYDIYSDLPMKRCEDRYSAVFGYSC